MKTKVVITAVFEHQDTIPKEDVGKFLKIMMQNAFKKYEILSIVDMKIDVPEEIEATLEQAPHWLKFPRNTAIPESLYVWADKYDRDLFKFNGNLVAAYHNQDQSEWIVVTDDGAFYKHNAKYAIWHKRYGRVAWSEESMQAMVSALMLDQTPPMDPDYET